VGLDSNLKSEEEEMKRTRRISWLGIFLLSLSCGNNSKNNNSKELTHADSALGDVNPVATELTAAQHLAEAEKALWGQQPNIVLAEEHLKAIQDSLSHAEKKEFQRLRIEAREKFGNQIDQVFLTLGMDVQVRFLDNNKKNLVLRWVLWNRPSVYQFINAESDQGSFFDMCEQTGIEMVRFDDGFDYAVTYDIGNKRWKR
jgi:hypothetical protein